MFHVKRMFHFYIFCFASDTIIMQKSYLPTKRFGFKGTIKATLSYSLACNNVVLTITYKCIFCQLAKFTSYSTIPTRQRTFDSLNLGNPSLSYMIDNDTFFVNV